MELGALVCTPRSPRCSRCPWSAFCRAHQLGIEELFPQREPQASVPHFDVAAAVVRRADGRVLVAQRELDDFLGGLWEFPGGKCDEGEGLKDCLSREMMEELGVEVEVGERVLELDHGYSHFRITLHVFECTLLAGEPQRLECADVRWATPGELADLPMSVTDRRIAQMVQSG